MGGVFNETFVSFITIYVSDRLEECIHVKYGSQVHEVQWGHTHRYFSKPFTLTL